MNSAFLNFVQHKGMKFVVYDHLKNNEKYSIEMNKNIITVMINYQNGRKCACCDNKTYQTSTLLTVLNPRISAIV